MKKIYIFTILILIIATLLVCGNSGENKSDTLKVGVILPLSGPAAKTGEEVLNSIKLANLSNLKLMVEDDQCSGKNALSSYEKLNASGVDIFYIACSGSVLSVYEKAKQNKDVILTAYAGSSEIRKTDDTVIRFIPDGLSISDSIITIVKKMNTEKIYVVYENADYPKSIADILGREFGDRVVLDTYKSDEKDFKSLVTRIKSSGINHFVFIPISDTAYKLFLGEMKVQGVSGKVIGDVNVCGFSFNTSEYGFDTTCFESRLSVENTEKYESLYLNEYGTKSNYTYYNAVTTDVFVYLNALRDVEGVKYKLVRDGHYGTYGTYKFTPDGEILNPGEYLFEKVK